jgi:colanic acid biosynthesis glycosyl transferase WcaI
LTKGVPDRKISVIPNFVDTEFVRPLPKRNKFSERLGLADKFVVMHSGNLGYVYDFDSLLDAAAMLAGEKEILFLIVGGGVAKAELERKAAQLELDNLRFLPFQPHEHLPWLRASADVPVSLYKAGSVRYSMPSKIYEIMASGRPLLASADAASDVSQLVERAGCGICVEPENPRQLADAILRLHRDPDLREEMGRNGRHWAERKYSKESTVQAYHRLFREIAGAGLRQSAKG